jgi:hypothetical protein
MVYIFDTNVPITVADPEFYISTPVYPGIAVICSYGFEMAVVNKRRKK